MNRRDTLIAGLLSLGLMALLLPLARLGVNAHHDGIMLKPALDVLSGQVLFRDTFTQYGALTTYLQVVALWVQPTLLSLRLMTVMAYGATLFFLYGSWRLILPRSLAVLSCGLFVLFLPGYEKDWLNQYWHLLPWASVFAMMLQSLGLFALCRVIRGEDAPRWSVVLGLACAGVFWCRQPVGLLMTGSLGAIWLALHWTNWAPPGLAKRATLYGFLGGFLAVHALMLADVFLSGAGPAWWYQNIVWPSQWAGTVPLTWQQFVTAFVHPAPAAWLLVLLLAAALPRWARRLRPDSAPRLLPVYYLGLGALLLWQHDRLLQVLALRDGGWTALFPLVVIAQAIISLTSVFTSRNIPKTTEYYLVGALAAVALGSLLQYYPLPDSWHILWALAPAFGLGVFVIWRGLAWPAPAVALALTAALLPALCLKVRSAADNLAQPWVKLTAPAVLRGMAVLPAQAQSIGRITDTLDLILQQNPDIPSAMIGNDALVLCFTRNRTNPTPYYVNWPGLVGDTVNQQRWRYIQRVRPLVFFQRAHWDAVGDFYRQAHYVPLLYLPEEALEIAVPQELAQAMGRTTYGAVLETGPAREPKKP